MQTSKKQPSKSDTLPENSIARGVMESIQQIDREARAKKLTQLESLESAKAAIHQRIAELDHQVAQIENAIASINGSVGQKGKRVRRNLDEVRERVLRWMLGRKGQKLPAGDLIQQFPELSGMVMSAFLKPFVQEGKLKADVSQGIRRTKYFAPG